MNFELNEQQQMLQESVSRFIQNEYDADTRYALAQSELGYSTDFWQKFAELGWLSIPFSEQFDGFDGNEIDIATVMEELGKGMVLEPFISTVVLAGKMLELSNNIALQQHYIPAIIGGEAQAAVAIQEQQSRFDWNNISTSAEKQADGSYIINGSKALIANAHNADFIIIAARTSGQSTDIKGISLFCLPMSTDGISLSTLPLMDGQKVSNIQLQSVKAPAESVLGDIDNAAELIQPAIQSAIIAITAEALGIMEKLNIITNEYTKTRKQFGTTISTFQVLQHRMVDTFVAYELTKSMLYRTLCDVTATDGSRSASDIEQSIHALKMTVAKYSKQVGDEAIQIHGGIGMTDELVVGHYVKRLLVINMLFGDRSYHQQQYINNMK